MNAWKVMSLVLWLALPALAEERVEVPKEIVEELTELGYELEVDAAGTASDLEAHPIKLNRDGEPELRVHGLGPGICGAANCVTWVFQKTANGYRLLLDAGSINRIEPQRSYTKGYRDLMVIIHGSAWESNLILYKFDGEYYNQAKRYFRTYQYEDKDGILREWKEPKTTRIACDVDCC